MLWPSAKGAIFIQGDGPDWRLGKHVRPARRIVSDLASRDHTTMVASAEVTERDHGFHPSVVTGYPHFAGRLLA